MERDCNKCVYSTRDGNCRKWECKGTVTVEDIRKEAIRDFVEWYAQRKGFSKEWADRYIEIYEKEHKNGTR